MKRAPPWVPLEVLANGVAEVNADIYMLTADRIYTSDLAALEGESPEGTFVPRAPGLAVPYQQPGSPPPPPGPSRGKHIGWVQPRGGLTPLTPPPPPNTAASPLGR